MAARRLRVPGESLPIATLTEIRRLAEQGYAATQIMRDLDLTISPRTVQRIAKEWRSQGRDARFDQTDGAKAIAFAIHDLAEAIRSLREAPH